MTNTMQLCRIMYYSLAVLHVSSDIFAHHQEHLNCITASGITHVCRCQLVLHTYVAASWQLHTCVIPEAVIQFRCSWWWAKISLETCRTAKEIINYPSQLHLVGHFLILFYDARKHEYQVCLHCCAYVLLFSPRLYPTYYCSVTCVFIYFVILHCSAATNSVLSINPLNLELNPICYLLALLGAHHFVHVSRIRVKLLTFSLLMSYIYIYIYIWSTHSWCF